MYILFIFVFCAVGINCQVDFSDRPRNFSVVLVHHTAVEAGGHVVISPFGIWTLMTGVALGASGNSYEELRSAFILPRSEKALLRGYKSITGRVLKTGTTDVSLVSKNYMFLDDDFEISPDFRRTIIFDFEAVIKVLDFNDPTTAARLANNYISNSGAKVTNVLTSDDFMEARMILTNVISFKGLWGLPFNRNDTAVEPFYGEDGSVIGEVNMMYQKSQFPFANIKQTGAFALELPYGSNGKYSMLILLPSPGKTVMDTYRTLATFTINDILERLANDTQKYGLEDVEVRIPRFKISTNVVLNKPLDKMGVRDIFEPRAANFARVTRESIYVSAIVHKADIEVTESGTVASASTSAVFADRISAPSYVANRPFIYFVMEKTTTTIIFGGIYSKPTVY
ncbi:Serine protease inhibitor 77Ba [Eumeta japonica]|uniref:Serine protease inhibitor 77Ba n=1 Tax=Eumeta variegata TaxID=151549 RepID=A0A4C1Z4C9_EUMVA|nr:Serine protease inhibitor 77Ba [Eumeta japonica]